MAKPLESERRIEAGSPDGWVEDAFGQIAPQGATFRVCKHEVAWGYALPVSGQVSGAHGWPGPSRPPSRSRSARV
jgi:hypothetical protein